MIRLLTNGPLVLWSIARQFGDRWRDVNLSDGILGVVPMKGSKKC
jgi:hypothetical protein